MPLDRETAAALMSTFELGRASGPVLPISRGAMGEISRIDTEATSYAVKELFAWNPGTGVDEEVVFTEQARTAGIRIPLEMRSGTGDLIVAVGDRRFRVYEWLEVGPTPTVPADPTLASSIGRIAATLHRLAEPSTSRIDGWYTMPPSAERWRDLVSRALDQQHPWAVDLVRALPSLAGLAALADAPRGEQVQICHRDLDPSNVLPLPDHDLAVLDWENLGPLEPEQEIGGLLVSWCTDAMTVDGSAVHALIEGYRQVIDRPLALRRSSFATAVVTWLNFLAVQTEGVLQAEPAGHREFAEKCVRSMLAAPLTVRLVDDIVAAAR